MITVYATGCFPGKPLESAEWLVVAEEYFEDLGIPLMTPYTCVIKELSDQQISELPAVLPGSVHFNTNSQISRQVASIEESAAVLVCLDGFGINILGSLEVMSAITTARLLGKPVMAFGIPPENLRISPWLDGSLYSCQLSLDEALETIKDFLGFRGYVDYEESIDSL